jgi:uncharacterized protein (TIGR03790 family)
MTLLSRARMTRPQDVSELPLLCSACVAIILLAVLAAAASAQSAENVAVVINDNSPASQRVGEYYARARGIPAPNLIRIHSSSDDTISVSAFVDTIENPIAAALARNGLQDRVLYLVLTKGIPLRVLGTGGIDGTSASVDSELTLLYRRLVGAQPPRRGRVDNPYYLGSRDVAQARPFTHREQDVFLVSRLDGFTVDDVIALIDRAKSPAADGAIVLDQRAPFVKSVGEDWIAAAATRLTAATDATRVVFDTTAKPVRGVSPALGYFSWGSIDPLNRVRKVDIGFAPGAIASTLDSADARTFREPPSSWTPDDGSNRNAWYLGSPHSLIGDLIREGVTGVAGTVAEPYLQSAVRPEILFPAYVAGFNLVESFYLAMPHLSWQTVVIGDPLCAPFRRQVLKRAEIEDGVDPASGLPSLFARRRLAAMAAEDRLATEPALALVVRSDALLARGDAGGARKALEKAVELAPKSPLVHVSLGNLLQLDGDVDGAIDHFRRALASRPNDAAALNNLAYALAVYKHAPEDARPFAAKALARSPIDPSVIDTAAWIEHLLGDDVAAAKLMARALRATTDVAEIHLHAAVIFAARGARAVADLELSRAIAADPALASHPDARRVRAWLDTRSGAPLTWRAGDH